MSFNNSSAAAISSTNNAESAERDILPLFVSLGPNAALPSDDYVRVVALSGGGGTKREVPPSRNSSHRDSTQRNGTHPRSTKEPPVKEPVRCDFALHLRGARHCRLLDAMLDAHDLHMSTVSTASVDGVARNKAERKSKSGINNLPSVVLPQATANGCKALFVYLDLITIRVPSTISKPLRAPLEDILQPWELNFLLKHCMDEATSRVIFQKISGDKDGNVEKKKYNGDARAMYHSVIVDRAPESLNLLIELALLSDFLIVEPLRQLTCAFLASLALNVSSEAELLRLSGLPRAMTEEELDPLYVQFPFLRPDTASDC